MTIKDVVRYASKNPHTKPCLTDLDFSILMTIIIMKRAVYIVEYCPHHTTNGDAAKHNDARTAISFLFGISVRIKK